MNPDPQGDAKHPGVIHVVASVAITSSGPSKSVLGLCRELSVLGWRPEIHTVSRKSLAGAGFTLDPPMSYDVPVVEHDSVAWSGALWSCPSMKAALRGAVRQGVPVLHSHGLWSLPTAYPVAVANPSTKVVVSPRGTLSEWAQRRSRFKKTLAWFWFQQRAVRAAACLHATAEAEAHAIRAAGFGAPIAIIPNGIDIPEKVGVRSSSKRRLLFLGRVHPVKGVDILLDAWREVESEFQEWELRIVGPDEDGYARKLRADHAGIGTRRVEFVGEKCGVEKWAEYSAADLYVLPSHSENFAITVAEALASGVPAIVSHGAPWPRLESEGCGWWIPIGGRSLADCLRYALTQRPEQLAAMGQRGREWMARDLGWPHLAERMAQTYSWLLEGGTPPPWVFRD